MKNEYGLAPCPFCGSLYTYVHVDDKDEHGVVCNNCGARGPTETWGSAEAIRRWNAATKDEEAASD